jgi:hypothetical protein
VSATVEIRLIGVDFAETMRQMRMWLDHHKVVPNAFRQSACPGGLALQVEFRLPTDATAFSLRFAGRMFGEAPESLGIAPAALHRD